jgi:hypothetical protein
MPTFRLLHALNVEPGTCYANFMWSTTTCSKISGNLRNIAILSGMNMNSNQAILFRNIPPANLRISGKKNSASRNWT